MTELKTKAIETLNQSAANREGGRQLLIQMADQLALAGDDTALGLLAELQELPRAVEDFAIRRALTQALIRLHKPPCQRVQKVFFR